MRLLMLGINHRTADVELRERIALAGEKLDRAFQLHRSRFPSCELVIVSTCNRTELYAARPSHDPPSFEQLAALLAEASGMAPDQVHPIAIRQENELAVSQLFRVSCGLDSMVLGETQILGQVKRAYEFATSREAVGPILHRVFQQAIGVAKQIRTETGIDAGRLSIGSVAVDFARRIFDNFSDKTILAIGAGEMAKITLRHLQDLKPARLLMTNRTLARAQALAATLNITSEKGGPRPFEELDQLLIEADIVVTSTGSPQPIITASRLKPLLKRRKFRPLFIIDIALPRDASPDVESLTNTYLYNIDDLQRVVEENQGQRSEQVAKCEPLLTDAVTRCMSEIQHRDIGQLIRAFRTRLHEIGKVEQERTLRKLANSKPQDVNQILEEHTNRLVNKILHMPLSHLDRSNPDAPLGFYAAAIRKLFDLPDEASQRHDEAHDAISASPAAATLPEAAPIAEPAVTAPRESPATHVPTSPTRPLEAHTP